MYERRRISRADQTTCFARRAEHKLEIEAKADGVMELCKAMRKVIADYDDSVKPKEASNRGLLATEPLTLPEKPSKNLCVIANV